MTTVELRLDVRHHLDPVDHKIGDQAVDLGVLHDHADHPRSTQVAFAELCAGEVLVVEASHADRLGRTAHATPASAASRSLSSAGLHCREARLRWGHAEADGFSTIVDGFRRNGFDPSGIDCQRVA